ncbi:MAG: ABC transporter permease [Microscillaceae bacterium]|nr:ABC transporter permease [Microscillaceae bacterium]
MNYLENVKEGLRSVQSNLLRSVLTALIITIGITALVGILTAIDSMQAQIRDSFADLGANSFDIKVPERQRGPFGRQDKVYPPIEYRQAKAYVDNLAFDAKISLSVSVTGAAEVKYLSKKTNPNVMVIGINEHYLFSQSLDLESGRNFSTIELNQASFVAILGFEIAETLFDKANPINELINIRGYKYKVVGVLQKKGTSEGGSGDRQVLIPLENARIQIDSNEPTYNISTILNSTTDFDYAIGEATSLMRRIRKDPLGMPESFEVERSETLIERLNNITSYFQLGGGLVSFITLLGAAIGLMNIMMVSVTERTREIGVRKALGATPRRIREQFLIEAIVICQLGGIAGIILGITIGNWVAVFLGSEKFIIPWLWMIIALFTCVFVGIASGFYPAYKASKLDPIESLRFE